MANRKITELAALTTPAQDDVIPIVDVSETSNTTKNKKITAGNLIQGTPSLALQFADGTASAPSIKFTSALTTGLYRSAANELSIATNGGQAIKVEANNKTTIYGDLVVTGGTTTISSTQIDVTDKNLQLATGNSSDSGADGGGLTLKGASDKTWNWVDSTDAWTANQHIDVTIGKVFKVAGTQVLSATTLGSGVVNSSLTSVGTLGSLTVTNAVTAGSLDISGGADIDGTLEADAYTVDGIPLNEFISDTVGAMVSSNTETNITVTYDDADNTLDFVIGTLNQDTTGNAATATALETARTIGGVSFDGTTNINLPGVNQTGNQNTTGSAATLTTARTIGGVSFDGSANINLPGVNAAGNQNTSGTAAGLSGTPNITVADVIGASLDISGNADIDGTLEADAYTVDGTALNEYIADTVGAMVSSNTETNIAVTYDDSDNTLDFVISSYPAASISGTTLASNVVTSSLTSVGTLGSLTVTNAVTAGSLDISGGVEIDGNLTLATNTKLGIGTASPQQTVQIDGSIYLGPNDSHNFVHTGGSVTYSADSNLYFVADSNDTTGPAPDGIFIWGTGSDTNTNTNRDFTLAEFGNSGKPRTELLVLNESGLRSGADSTYSLGTTTNRWANVYGDNFVGTSLDISGNADIDGILEADAITVDGTALNEYIADTVGAMVSSNTESDIVVTYQDSDNTLDFTVSNISGNAGTATALQNARTIGGVSFDGTANIDLPGVNTAGNQNTSGTAANLSGTPNITVGVVTAASLDISGNADIDGTLEADAITVDGTALNEYISDTIGAMVGSNTETGITVSYDDSDNTLDFVIGTLNQDTTGTAALATEFTVTANNSTDETVYPTFVDGATGSQGAETDTALTYNPSTGLFTSTVFGGSGANLTNLNASQLSSGTIAAARLSTATTQSAGNNSTKIATTAYVETAVSNLVDGSPGALNTLNELAAALGDDANFSTTVTNSIAAKLPLAGGTMTGALNMGNQNITNGGTITGTFVGNITGNVTGNTSGTAGGLTGTPNITVGVVTAGSLDISGNVDVDGTLETDALTIDGVSLAETIADTVGAMVGSNTETGITVTYDDSDNTLDFVVGTLNQSTTGNAATATALATARAINGVNFDGTAPITITAAAGTLTGNTLASGVTASSLTSVGTLTGLTVSGNISMTGTGAIDVPTGTTAQRPSSPTTGLFRYNSTEAQFEGYTASGWGAIAGGGGGASDFRYLALRNAANNGAASYPASDFTLVAAGTTGAVSPNAANTLLVSVGGVIQQPNEGTSTPSTGFAISGSTIKFGSNISAAPDFIIYQLGAGLGTPSDNTITSDKIVNGAIVNIDINASAAIAGSKISPDFGSQNITTSGNITSNGNLVVSSTAPKILLTDTNHNDDFSIRNDNGTFKIYDETDGAGRLKVYSSGTVEVLGNLDVGAGLDVTGNITVTGTVDGVDIAALNTTVGTKLPLAGGTLTGNVIHNDNVISYFGSDSDLSMHHTGATGYVKNTTGTLYIQDDSNVIIGKVTDSHTGMKFIGGGALELYHNNNLRFATSNDGATLTGRLTPAANNTYGLGSSGLRWANFYAVTGNFSGTVTATTQSANDNSTKVATTAYTDTAIANLVDSSPGTLNTLNELAAALGDDANFSTTVTNSIATKLPLAGGTLTGELTIPTWLVHAGDSNTKFGFEGPDTITFETAGVERLRIASDGKIYVGGNGASATAGELWFNDTSAYSSVIKQVAGSSALTFHTGQSQPERLRITSGGWLGLGTNPQRLLHIHETSAASAYLHMTNGTTGAASTDGFSLYVATDGQTYYRARESGGTHRFFTAGTERLKITSDGTLRISTRNSSSGGELGFQFGSFGIRTEDTGGFNWWRIDNNYGGWNSNMISFRADGRVGINEASPDKLLHVTSTTDVEQIRVESTANSGRAQVNFVNPHGNWVAGLIGGTTEGDFITYTGSAKNFRVYTTNAEKFRITSTQVASFGNSSPPAWQDSSGYYNLQLGNSGYFRADTDTSSNFLAFGVNAYRDSGGWKHVIDGRSTQINNQGGAIQFYVSATGTAGGGISWNDTILKIDHEKVIIGHSDDEYLQIPGDEKAIEFDEGQKMITVNDGAGNFNFCAGHNNASQHVNSSNGTSGTARMTFNTDGQNGTWAVGVGPLRSAGANALHTCGIGVVYSGSGMNQAKYLTGSANDPNGLATAYPILHRGNAMDGTWANNSGDGFKVLGDGGSIAITTNDGGGNCNVCFNCANNAADAAGSAWRIRCDIDSTNSHFLIRNNTSVTNGGSVASMTTRLEITESGTFSGSSSNNISDQRLKKNIATITNATATIKSLKGRTFEWKDGVELESGTQYGFIAQEMESVVSDLVTDGTDTGIRAFDKDGNILVDNKDENAVEYSKAVNVDGVIPILVEALKEAVTKIETLETKVAALEAG